MISPWLDSDNEIIKSERVVAAMKAVDRKNFCKQNAYLDSPQSIGYQVTISAPHMVRECCFLYIQNLNFDNKTRSILILFTQTFHLDHQNLMTWTCNKNKYRKQDTELMELYLLCLTA